MQQAVQHAAADGGQTVEWHPPGQAKDPWRPDLGPDLDGVLPVAHSPGFAIRWMSIRKLRVPAIGNASTPRRSRERASLRVACRRMSTSVAAPATKPVAATAAAWTAGRAGDWCGLDRPHLGEDRDSVDGFLVEDDLGLGPGLGGVGLGVGTR